MILPAAPPASGELIDLMASLKDDPLGFVRAAYPWREPGPLEEYDGPDKWQSDLLEDIGREVRARNFDGINPVMPIRMAVSSGHGIGKSSLAGMLTDWILSTRPNSVGTVTANTLCCSR